MTLTQNQMDPKRSGEGKNRPIFDCIILLNQITVPQVKSRQGRAELRYSTLWPVCQLVFDKLVTDFEHHN